MHWLAILPLLLVAGCSTKMGRDGRTETTVDAKYLVKSEVDRIADTVRSDTVDGLLLIADKLYKRNPREWKKAGMASRGPVVRRSLLLSIEVLTKAGSGSQPDKAADPILAWAAAALGYGTTQATSLARPGRRMRLWAHFWPNSVSRSRSTVSMISRMA